MSHQHSIEWREDLPDRCPPESAGTPNAQVFLRLVDSAQPADDAFASHAALGYACSNPEILCEWSSCSMFLTTYEKHKLTGLRKFKRLKKMTHVARVAVNENSGKVVIKPTKHVDLWMFKSYSPSANIVSVVEVGAYEPS